jgi:hypothetical protein
VVELLLGLFLLVIPSISNTVRSAFVVIAAIGVVLAAWRYAYEQQRA